jgi:hypothetical protein
MDNPSKQVEVPDFLEAVAHTKHFVSANLNKRKRSIKDVLDGPHTLYIEGFSRFVTSTTAPIAPAGARVAGRDSHPLRNRAFARRTK